MVLVLIRYLKYRFVKHDFLSIHIAVSMYTVYVSKKEIFKCLIKFTNKIGSRIFQNYM